MRGVFELYDARGERMRIAAELLAAGRPFTFNNVLIRREPNGSIVCEAVTSWYKPIRDDSIALEDLSRAKAVFSALCECSAELAELMRSVPVRYAVIEDLDISTFEVCREVDGKIEWATDVGGAG